MNSSQKKAGKATGKVLYYGTLAGNQELLLQKILAQLGVRSRKIESHELGRTVGALAGLENPADSSSFEQETPQDTVAVMHGLSDARIQQFLSALRQEKIQIELKAVVTDRNRDWPFIDLIQELRREHAAMKVYQSFHNAVQKAEKWLAAHAESFQAQAGKKEVAQELETVLHEARQTLQKAQETGEIDLSGLKETGQLIADLIDRLAESEPS